LARCLIIGCGCRGRWLSRALIAQGHAVRGTTRTSQGLAEIEACGAEPFLGDPDRVSTIASAFEHVSVVCVLLGSASGATEALESLHGTRLEMMLTKMLDTTIRGVVYESAGTVGRSLLARGSEIVTAACSDARIPFVLLDADPAEPDAWLRGATEAVSSVLG
jgi:nucleoside-diphosphate-sugar epimerase